MTEGNENQQYFQPTSILSRLDRLGHLVRYLQDEKQRISKRQLPGTVLSTTVPYLENSCKPLSNSVDDIHIKGTILERITMLENSVLQLSLAMEEITSSSNSSSIAMSQDNIAHCLPTKQDSGITASPFDDKQNHEPKIEAAEANKAESYNKKRITFWFWMIRLGTAKWLGRALILCFLVNIATYAIKGKGPISWSTIWCNILPNVKRLIRC